MDLEITVDKQDAKEARKACLQYPVVERVVTRVSRSKYGVTYPDRRDLLIYFKPFWQWPGTNEVNREMSEMQELPYRMRMNRCKKEFAASINEQ